MNNTKFPSYEQVQQARSQLRDLAYQHWFHDDFLTRRWWLLVFFSVVPWFIWWRIADKKRLHELLLYGTFIVLCTIALDNIGTELIWWEYPDKILQMVPAMIPSDITFVPTFMMIGYQLARTWRFFIVVNVTLGLFMAFVGEPFFIWLDFYKLHAWKLWYSLIFYIVVAVIGRWFVLKTMYRGRA